MLLTTNPGTGMWNLYIIHWIKWPCLQGIQRTNSALYLRVCALVDNCKPQVFRGKASFHQHLHLDLTGLQTEAWFLTENTRFYTIISLVPGLASTCLTDSNGNSLSPDCHHIDDGSSSNSPPASHPHSLNFHHGVSGEVGSTLLDGSELSYHVCQLCMP